MGQIMQCTEKNYKIKLFPYKIYEDPDFLK